MDVSLKDIILPVEGHEIWDYYVIGLFIFGLMTLFLLGDKSDQQDMTFVSIAVFVCILDKAYAIGYIFEPDVPNPTREQRIETHVTHFATFMMRVLVFVLPLMVAGRTRVPRVRILTGLFAIAGGVYMFVRWYDEMRGSVFGFIEPQIWLQGSMFILVSGELIARNLFRRIDRQRPVFIRGMLPPDDTEI